CREFGRTVIPVLEDEYIDAGTVSLEYRHLAILGEESVNAAAASECAADQDLFWPYHDLLVGETERTYKEHARTLQATAAGAALNLETFDACVDAGTHVAAVQAATVTAWSTLSGSGTARIAVPLFLVNDGFWRVGIPTMDELRAEITRLQPASASSE
ncbi:MAG: thioredoxin domain-containing protein, partial [Chloroflexi bacterium]|nr:thioredoxin domain-containing protein [Chloroflexota bacterium]